MSDDQFTRLFKYMIDMRQEMDNRFSEVDRKFDRVYSYLDTVIKRQETQEHERWFEVLAAKAGVKLLPDS